MTLEEQLAQEIKAQYRSVRQFALCHGINYSQLTSALKRGIAGAGVESMLTVFNALGLDIERHCLLMCGGEDIFQIG